ncbi:MAG: hypothetical protein HC896_00200 [Bacteroidales bacterium]|nr:hypothetical protein [Bacteroidales bacterium]
MIIAIDFDGTIVEHAFPEIGKPIEGAFEVMKKLQMNGHQLILWTCRNNEDPSLEGRKVLEEAAEFCESYGLEFDAINCNVGSIGINPEPKVYADLYVDDHNFPKMEAKELWNLLEMSLC